MEKLIWHNETRKVNDLIPYEKNPRKMGEEEFKKLVESIDETGYAEVVAINTDNKIVAGHMRVRALKYLNRGEEMIDVRVPNRALTQKEFERYLLQSNRVHGMFDFDMLANSFEVADLTNWGFSLGELGLSDSSGREQIDVDNMASDLETYMNSDIKQIVLYFKGTEYGDIIRRIDSIMPELGAENYSEVFLKLLEEHENINTL